MTEASNTPFRSKTLRAAAALTVGLFCAYALTLSLNHAGYEAETIAQARAILRGRIPHGRAGLLDVALYLPFAAVSEVLARLDVMPMFQEFIPNLAPALAMALTGALVFLMAGFISSPRASLAAALAFAFTTMAWPYSKMGMESGLTLATALATLGMFHACAGRRPNLGWIIHVIGLSAILFSKTQGPFIIALYLACDLWLIVHGVALRPSRRVVMNCGAGLAAAVGVWILTNHLRHGGWLLSSSYSARWEMEATPGYFSRIAGLIASPGKSLFIYNPSLLAALVCAPALCRRFRPFAAALVLLVAPQIFFHAWFRTWADETWGPRRLMNLMPIMVLPLALAFERASSISRGAGAMRVFAGAALLAGFSMQALAVSVNYAHVAWALQTPGLATQRNFAWRWETAPWAIEVQIARSMLREARGADPLILHFPKRWAAQSADEIHPWNRPEVAPDISRQAFRGLDASRKSLLIDLTPFSKTPDLWWVQRRRMFPDRPIWRDKLFYIMPLFLAGLVIGLAGSWRWTQPQAIETDSGAP